MRSRYWGLHRDVHFDTLLALAEEHLETVRRRALQAGKAGAQPQVTKFIL